MRKTLNYSNPFFTAEYIKNEASLELAGPTIIVNLAREPIPVDFASALAQDKSCLLKDVKLGKVTEAITVNLKFDPARPNPMIDEFCQKNWDDNKVRYPDDPSKWGFVIRRSPVEKMPKLELNCWFLPANAASSIHMEHPSREVHTQIYGLGIMNKFSEQKADTLYQRMYMAPGFTHDYFFDADGKYPWHQYEAVTASIWMAITRG